MEFTSWSYTSWNTSWSLLLQKVHLNSASIYLFKVNNLNHRAMSEICSKFLVKALKRCQWHCSGVFIVSFEQI